MCRILSSSFNTQRSSYELLKLQKFPIQLIPYCSLCSSGCTRDYVRLHLGSSTVSHTAILYGGYSGGRICNRQDSRYIFFARHEIITVYYRTDGSNVRSDVRGLEVGYDIEGKAHEAH